VTLRPGRAKTGHQAGFADRDSFRPPKWSNDELFAARGMSPSLAPAAE
jgi:hypothetical protein